MEINKNLRLLKFKGNRCEPSFCVNSATLLDDALRSTKTLESLSFGFFQMPSISLSSINSATAANKSLRKLYFVVCQLEDNQIAEVIKCITDHETIEELDISRNRCKDEGLRALVELLSSTDCKLTVLILSSLNFFTSDVALLLCTLWEGHSLEELNVSRNEISSIRFWRRIESWVIWTLSDWVPWEVFCGIMRRSHKVNIYWLDMNRMGCVLLGKRDFALSVWPLVFERTNLMYSRIIQPEEPTLFSTCFEVEQDYFFNRQDKCLGWRAASAFVSTRGIDQTTWLCKSIYRKSFRLHNSPDCNRSPV